jgi:glycerol-3-phosphate acyltransferase PlsY
MTWVLWIVGAYVAGSIPASYLAGRLAGIDLREHGSKNLGATNVYRVLGWGFAVPVGLFDIAKGAVPVFLVTPLVESRQWIPVVVGLAAVLGHVFPLFMRFRGGKGVATAAGVVLGLAPVALGISAAVWVAVLAASGYVSLASLLGALTFPVGVALLGPANPYTLGLGIALAVFIVYTHRTNMQRLLAGTENRFGRRRHAAGAAGEETS